MSSRCRDLAAPCCTRLGVNGRKYHTRAVFQSVAFLVLLIGAFIYNSASFDESRADGSVGYLLRREEHPGVFTNSNSIEQKAHAQFFSDHREDANTLHDRIPGAERPRSRRTVQTCDEIDKADPKWMLVFYIVGVLYMFLALAIVCDEFFVPALEEMASSHHLDLSMDVAGATLMAAGGSAPELFANLFGTFQESEIGFGTIVGSAVFNVLFVIAMCAVFAKETLHLTWWPLFRDSCCYTVGLVVLVTFMTYVSPGEIEWWESLILFSMYLMYCFMMKKNADLYKYLTGKELVRPEEMDDEDEKEESRPANEAILEQVPDIADKDQDKKFRSSNSSAGSVGSAKGLGTLLGNRQLSSSSYFSWQGTFRAGILKLLRDPGNWVDVGGVGIVAKMAGDADKVFQDIDKNGDHCIDRDELRLLFEQLDAQVSPAELDEVFSTLDENKDGIISEDEFHKWYTTSKELIRSQTRLVFDSLDNDKSGTIDKYEVKALLLELDPRVTDEDCAEAINEMYQHGSRDEITFEEFEQWYESSIIYDRQKKAVEEDMKGVFESLKPPFGDGWLAWLQYLVVLPLVGPMAVTVPDVRVPGRGKYCYIAFFMSIGWIALFSYAMVSWAEIIGNTIGIPSVIMGLTVLAAGTSVPDLLTSVIVARRGSGDMAVSSSIGSNIFDILVGLPFPWLLYHAIYQDSVFIVLESVEINLLLLVGMLIFVVASIHCQGWKLTKTLGALMMIFYAGYLTQAIIQELPFATCIEG